MRGVGSEVLVGSLGLEVERVSSYTFLLQKCHDYVFGVGTDDLRIMPWKAIRNLGPVALMKNLVL